MRSPIRKSISIMTLGAMLFTAGLIADSPKAEAAPSNPIKVTWNDKTINFPDQQPIIQNGRVLVPARFIVEQIPGYDVIFVSPPQGVFSIQPVPNPNIGKPSLILTIGKSDYVFVDPNAKDKDQTRPLYQPLEIINGRMMISARAVGELVGKVTWDNSTRTVAIQADNPRFMADE